MTDRFDLEQQILECWNVTKDVDLIYEAVMDRSPELSNDDLANLLLGIKTLYELKFEKVWATFEIMIRQNQFKKEDYVLEKENLIREIKNLSANGFAESAEYGRGYEHGRDDSITVIETA